MVMMVWQANERNEWDTLSHQSLGAADGPVFGASELPDPFSLPDPTTAKEILQAAGFADVDFLTSANRFTTVHASAWLSAAALRSGIAGAIASAKAPADAPMARLISRGLTAGTERGCRSLNPGKRSATAADLRSAVVRTSSGYIGAVDNPNNSTAVVAVKSRPNRDGTATGHPVDSDTRPRSADRQLLAVADTRSFGDARAQLNRHPPTYLP
jgi:hypothetical protein